MSEIFTGGTYRQGFGEDDLADISDDFGSMPSDFSADSMIGADDLSSGFGAGGDDPYANVNTGPANGGNAFTNAMGEFYGKEFKEGLSAFGKLFPECYSVLGKLPIGSLGGLWAGWVLLGLIGLPVGTVMFLVTQHYINAAGGVALGNVGVARAIANCLLSSGILFLGSGALFGTIMTSKLKRGDRTLTGVELEITSEDAAEDADGEFVSEDSVYEGEYAEGGDLDSVYDMGDNMVINPYDGILQAPVEEEKPAFQEVERKVVVNNEPPEVINRSLDNINSLSAGADPKEAIIKIAKDILPCYNPTFTEVKTIESGSPQWNALEDGVLSAIRLVTGAESDDITTRILSITKSAMSYVITATRFMKLKVNHLPQFCEELKAYVSPSDDDNSGGAVEVGDKPQVVCQASFNGDKFVITVVMPSKKLISLGDIYNTDTFETYRKKKKMPVVLGLDATGKMLQYDAKPDSAVMLCGQTRSGKSWFTVYYLLNFMLQQSPMQHQFVLVDPKDTGLFRALSYMPHVMGLHCPSDTNPKESMQEILTLLREFVYTEGERRKALFKEAGYENYWDYIAGEGEDSLPLLTFVLDEYLSVNAMFRTSKDIVGEDLRPTFLNLINVLVSKYPAYGLRLIIIPHRVPGAVEPVTRDLMKFKATFKSSEDLSTANLGLNKVGIPLPNTGDMAWTSEMQSSPTYTHTLCVGDSDGLTKDIFKLIAKAYYKLGVDMPDMSSMPCCFNRNDEQIVADLKDFKPGSKKK